MSGLVAIGNLSIDLKNTMFYGFFNPLYITGGNHLINVRKYEISTPSVFILFYVIVK